MALSHCGRTSGLMVSRNLRFQPSCTPLLSKCSFLSTDSQSPKLSSTPAVVKPYNEIPKKKLFLGLNWELMKNTKALVEYVAKQFGQYGKIYRDQGVMGYPEFVYVVDPSDVEKVFRVGDKGYPMRFPITVWGHVRDELKLPYGMFLEENENWLKQRIPISKYIMMPRKMADSYRPFNDVSLDLVRYIKRNRGEEDLLKDISSALNKWSFESVSVFLLGKRLGSLEEPMPEDCREFIECMQDLTKTTNKILMAPPIHTYFKTMTYKALVRQMKTLYTIASGHVQARIEEIEKTAQEGLEEDQGEDDFLSHMIHSGKMPVDEIAVNAIDLMGAGVDTTSLTMTACLYSLACNVEVQEKLRSEVNKVVGQEGVVTPTHIQDMPYLRDCIKETQRLYPIAAQNARILKEDITLSGYNVPAGVPIVMTTAVSGKLPEYFPEPDRFMPERWSRDNKELPNPFLSLPFGFGRRMCVGRRVAELEMHVMLAQVIKNFDLRYTEDKPIKYILNWFYRPEREVNLVFRDL